MKKQGVLSSISAFFRKLIEFLCEANGQFSIVRLALLLANIVMLYSIGIWGTVCLRTNTMQEFPWHITVLVCSANGWKVVQKFTEVKPVEEPTGENQ